MADKTRQGLWAVGSDNFPGSLLIRLGLGHDSVARHNVWEEMQALSQVIKYTFPSRFEVGGDRRRQTLLHRKLRALSSISSVKIFSI